MNILIALTSLFLLLINTFWFHNPTFGLIFFLLYTITLAEHIGNSILNKNTTGERIFYGLLLVLPTFIVVNSIIYYIYGTTLISSALILAFSFSFFFKKSIKQNLSIQIKLPQNKEIFWLASPLILDIFLILILFLNRTTEVMPSPWHAVSPWFFLLFALSTGLLIYNNYKFQNKFFSILNTSLHFFLAYAVATIVYPLGFGFDAFIHRATETWIQTNGFILPKTPYYIGQYSLVVWLSNLTSLSIIYTIDVYLVPILSAIFLPYILAKSLVKFTQENLSLAINYTLVLLFVPLFSLNLTTPHNLVLFFIILIISLSINYLSTGKNKILLIMLGLAATITHPLVGVSSLFFVFTLLFIKNQKYLLVKNVIYTTIIALLTPIMFSVRNLMLGQGLPILHNPLTKLNDFFSLFAKPYWYAKKTTFIFDSIYFWQDIIPIIFIIIGLFGIWLLTKKDKRILTLPLTSLGLIISAWLLRSWITYPDVISYEQDDYPWRLIVTSLLFLLPFTMYGLYKLIRLLNDRLGKIKILKPSLVIFFSLIIMLSFYFSYPQRNIKSRFPGFNVSAYDMEASQWIHENNDEYDYIVLSNQLVSSAALTQYSFAKYFDTSSYGQIFYYSIPTGGPLYKFYGQMLYEGQKNEYMQSAMALAGVNKAYFVVNSYWAKYDEIVEGAKKTAASWQTIGDNKITIFTYYRD